MLSKPFFSPLLTLLQVPRVVGGHHLFQMETPKQVLNSCTNIMTRLNISVSVIMSWRVDRSKHVMMVNGLERLDASVSKSFLYISFCEEKRKKSSWFLFFNFV